MEDLLKKGYDIEAMSELLGLPIEVIKQKLGIPFPGQCKASTVEEARKEYFNARTWKEKIVAEFIEKTLKNENRTLVELERAGKFLFEKFNQSEAQKIIFVRWNELSKEEVERASTIKEVREAYLRAPENSEAASLAYAKAEALILQAVEQATTIAELEATDDPSSSINIPSRHRELKRIELAKTIEEIAEAYRLIKDPTLKHIAFEKATPFFQKK